MSPSDLCERIRHFYASLRKKKRMIIYIQVFVCLYLSQTCLYMFNDNKAIIIIIKEKKVNGAYKVWFTETHFEDQR